MSARKAYRYTFVVFLAVLTSTAFILAACGGKVINKRQMGANI